MHKIVLDPSSRRKVKSDYQIIENESEFLSSFDLEKNLWIKGKYLSLWARAFYQNRNIKFEELNTPEIEIETVLKVPTHNFSQSLIESILDVIENCVEKESLNIANILKVITGEKYWEHKPTWEHHLKILFSEYHDNLKPLIENQCATAAKPIHS